MEKSIPLTLGLCATFIAAFSGLTSPDTVPPRSVDRPELPEDIAAGEAEYEAHQRGIEQALRRVHLSNLDEPPEVLRDRMEQWKRDNRQVLEEQVARSANLDALHASHRIHSSQPSERLAEFAPRSAEEAASAGGRRWALAHDLALVREANTDAPERLRDAMNEWFQAHGAELNELVHEMRTEATSHRVSGPPNGPNNASPRPRTNELPKNAPERLRRLISLHLKMQGLIEAYPSPEADHGQDLNLQHLQAWRENIERATKDTRKALEKVQREITEDQRRLTNQHYYDQPD